MKFKKMILNQTPLHTAILNNNAIAVKLLLEHPDIDVNIKYIINNKIFICNFFFSGLITFN